MNVNVEPAESVAGATRTRGWYHGWNIVALCIASMTVANGLTYNAFSLFLRPLSQELQTPISSLTLSLAGLALVCALLSPLVGFLADKYPVRRLLTLGLLGMALFYVGVGSVTAVWQVWALYWVLGSVSLLLSTAVVTNAVISRWFVRRRGLALGMSAFGMGLAGVVLPPLIGMLLPGLGWRMIWRGFGLFIALVIVPLVFLLVRDRPTEVEGRHYMIEDAQVAGLRDVLASGAGQMGWRQVFARRNFWLLLGIYLPMVALNGAVVQNIVPYAVTRGLTAQFGASLLALLSLAHIATTPIFGMLSDRLGNRLPFVGVAVVLITGSLLLAFTSQAPIIVVGCLLVGVGGAWFTLLGAAIATEFGADGVGRAFGLCMLFVPLGSSASFVLAKTQETTGSYAPALIGMAAVVGLSGLLSLMLRERRAPVSPQVT
jgi:MFS family permease